MIKVGEGDHYVGRAQRVQALTRTPYNTNRIV
jgi:hypothetical protein